MPFPSSPWLHVFPVKWLCQTSTRDELVIHADHPDIFSARQRPLNRCRVREFSRWGYWEEISAGVPFWHVWRPTQVRALQNRVIDLGGAAAGEALRALWREPGAARGTLDSPRRTRSILRRHRSPPPRHRSRTCYPKPIEHGRGFAQKVRAENRGSRNSLNTTDNKAQAFEAELRSFKKSVADAKGVSNAFEAGRRLRGKQTTKSESRKASSKKPRR
jgi:hypothetical protein